MSKSVITIGFQDRTATIPNEWHLLTPELFLKLHALLLRFSQGELSPGIVKALYVCDAMGWSNGKITGYEAINNLTAIADQVTFIFNIVYPHDVYSAFDEAEIAPYLKLDPTRSKSAIAKYLSTTSYQYAIESCFCAQLMPCIKLDKTEYHSYTVNTTFGQLTTNLSAIQYIEARTLINGPKQQFPLLAAILYFPGKYDSEKAHELADKFKDVPEGELSAIAFNFIAFNNFLFKKTEFSLLTASTKTESLLSVGPADSLYNLSSDGYGDINQIKLLNLIEYLTLCRKKTIDAIRSMHSSKIPVQDIANESGLPIQIVNEIIQ